MAPHQMPLGNWTAEQQPQLVRKVNVTDLENLGPIWASLEQTIKSVEGMGNLLGNNKQKQANKGLVCPILELPHILGAANVLRNVEDETDETIHNLEFHN